jgi:hypothetical protein
MISGDSLQAQGHQQAAFARGRRLDASAAPFAPGTFNGCGVAHSAGKAQVLQPLGPCRVGV